jgi:hypothetical protein
MDAVTEAWVRTIATKIRVVAPQMLLTPSSFYLASTGGTDFDGPLPRKPATVPHLPYPLRPNAMIAGGANLIDIHTYPSPARPGFSAFHVRAGSLMRAEGISGSSPYPYPLIAGEFGLSLVKGFAIADTLNELNAARPALCPYHFDGYVVWSWNDADKTAMPANDALTRIVAPRYAPKFCGQAIG